MRSWRRLTASFLKLDAWLQLNSAFKTFIRSQSLNSAPFWKIAGSGNGGPNSGTSSLAVTATLYTVWSVLGCSTCTTIQECTKCERIMFGQKGVLASWKKTFCQSLWKFMLTNIKLDTHLEDDHNNIIANVSLLLHLQDNNMSVNYTEVSHMKELLTYCVSPWSWGKRVDTWNMIFLSLNSVYTECSPVWLFVTSSPPRYLENKNRCSNAPIHVSWVLFDMHHT